LHLQRTDAKQLERQRFKNHRRELSDVLREFRLPRALTVIASAAKQSILFAARWIASLSLAMTWK
jgi:hypothetical protein